MDRCSSDGESTAELPPPVRRDLTMLATSEEGKALIKDSVLAATRSGTRTVKQTLEASTSEPIKRKAHKSPQPLRPKRDSTIASTVKEAKLIFGRRTGSAEVGRQLRAETKRRDVVPKVKRDNTMKKTAQEGKQYLGQEFLDRMKDTS